MRRLSQLEPSIALTLALLIAPMFSCFVGTDSALASDESSFYLPDFHAETIYGRDSRREAYELRGNPMFDAFHDASVAMITTQHLVSAGNGNYWIRAPRFQDDKKLCSSERFLDEPTAADCSGTLVNSTTVLTAGHCITDANECRNSNFVFNYAFSRPGQENVIVPRSEIYSCQQIIYREEDSDSHPYRADFALIRLDRPVPNHRPANLDAHHVYSVGEPLIIAGYPSGLPLKFADGVIRSIHSKKPTFDANLDAFGGNSGSPVYSLKTGAMIGVMIDGEEDYDWTGKCRVSKKCSDTGTDCLGQGVVRITDILRHLTAAQLPR
jgi:hypothetical protein